MGQNSSGQRNSNRKNYSKGGRPLRDDRKGSKTVRDDRFGNKSVFDNKKTSRPTGEDRMDKNPIRNDNQIKSNKQARYENDENHSIDSLVIGRNPVRELLKSEREIDKLYVAEDVSGGSTGEILRLARENRVVISRVNRHKLDNMAPGSSHQGFIARTPSYEYSTIDDMFDLAKERDEDPLIVILDGITDPHNLGAIIRSAECTGAHGVIVPKHRASGATPTVVKASAGAIEYVPLCKVANLNNAIKELKEKGVWLAAADMSGENYTKQNLKGPLGIVIGGEGKGVSRLIKENCDFKVSMPLKGKIESLNASVAAAVLLYEVVRQRDSK